MRWIRLLAATMSLLVSGCAHPASPQRELMIAHIQSLAQRSPALAADPFLARAIAAERTLRREAFVPHRTRPYANIDAPLEIGWGQTISDPWIVALMTAAARVRPGANVLEIGTGSGYQAAVLARLGARVTTVEIVPQLARRAAITLRRLGFGAVTVRQGDGFAGRSERAPFDAILVTAGSDRVPQPLLDQLAPGGRLVMPIGPSTFQEQLLVLAKDATGAIETCSLGATSFVPFTGKGERPDGSRGLIDRTLPRCFGIDVT